VTQIRAGYFKKTDQNVPHSGLSLNPHAQPLCNLLQVVRWSHKICTSDLIESSTSTSHLCIFTNLDLTGPIMRRQVLACAPHLSQLHMQPDWLSPWTLLASMPRLRDLSIGWDWPEALFLSALSGLNTLSLSFSKDKSVDLSGLTALQNLTLFGRGVGVFRGALPPNLTYLCLRNAVQRY